MTFLRRAQEMASSVRHGVADVASQASATLSDPATGERLHAAVERAAASTREGLTAASDAVADPANQAAAATKARVAGRKAKRTLSEAVDKIDPDLFADVVIKATALQERINGRLVERDSPYRIGGLSIAVAFPLPNISFSITRLKDPTQPGKDLEPEIVDAPPPDSPTEARGIIPSK